MICIDFGMDIRFALSNAVRETMSDPYREPTNAALKRPVFSRISNMYMRGRPTETSNAIIKTAQNDETILPSLPYMKMAAKAPMMNSSE